MRKINTSIFSTQCDLCFMHIWIPLLSMFHAYLVPIMTDLPFKIGPPLFYPSIIDNVTNFMAVGRTFFIKYIKKSRSELCSQNFSFFMISCHGPWLMVFIQFYLDLKWNFYKASLQVALEIRSDRNVEINQGRLSEPSHQFHRKYNHLKNPYWNEMDQDLTLFGQNYWQIGVRAHCQNCWMLTVIY